MFHLLGRRNTAHVRREVPATSANGPVLQGQRGHEAEVTQHHSNVSTQNHSNISTHHHSNVSTQHHSNVSTQHHSNVSTQQHSNVSTQHHSNVSTQHQGDISVQHCGNYRMHRALHKVEVCMQNTLLTLRPLINLYFISWENWSIYTFWILILS